MNATPPKPLTGRKVFLITASAFGIIIAVNLTLAFQAVSTFPGLETKNSYVASQRFEADRAAQRALGWQVAADIEDGALRLTIADPDGQAVNPASLEATLGRATHVAEDIAPRLAFDGTAHVAPVDLAPGYWTLRLKAEAADGTAFRQRLSLRIR